LYKAACAAKGIKVNTKTLAEGMGNKRGTRSAKVELFKRDSETNQ